MSNQEKLFVGLAKTRVNNFQEKEISVGFQQKDLDLLQSKLNDKGWVNFTVKTSKEGKPYLQIDTWKPKASEAVSNNTQETGEELPF